MAAVSRLTPRARPADQPRTAPIAPPRAWADGWDARGVDGGVTATGVLVRRRGPKKGVCITLY